MANTDHLDQGLVDVLIANDLLSLNVGDPSWEDSRNYVVDTAAMAMYFAVSKPFLEDRDLDAYEVLLWSNPRVVVTGRLVPARSEEDASLKVRLLIDLGLEPDKADYMVFDQRNHRPRKNQYKLLIRGLRKPQPTDVKTRDAISVLGADWTPDVT